MAATFKIAALTEEHGMTTIPANETRCTREYRQTLDASRERVFPLLCPEREKDWGPR